MKKYILIMFSFVVLQPGQSQSKVGTSAAPFLGIGVGPSAIGMSGAITSIATDASVIYWNPGAISRLGKNQIMVSQADWIVDTKLNFISMVFALDRSNSVGFYLTHLDYGREEITDLQHQDGTGLYWTASDIVAGGAYARNLTDRFSIGGTFKYIYQQIYNERAGSMALDVGLLYKTPGEKFRIGMSISNFGSDMNMDGKDLFRQIDLDPAHEGHNETLVAKMKTDYWPLPLFFRVGISSDIISTSQLRLTLASDVFIPSDDVETAQLGIEMAFLDHVFVRAGYQSIGNANSEEGLTVGAGAKVFASGMALEIDYTMQEFGIFGYIPHLGVLIEF